MSNLAIKVENVSKMYRLGDVGTGTIGDDITRFWYKIRGKEDPFSKIAISNDRSQKAQSDYVLSLKDINFEIKQGDAVGIIGRNGAGKSTLLKILSKITAPTTGNIKINGRVASLLEVGTGFNPDLTGRQNIYMNGAILGMTRAEVTKKLDEIIDFSGVEGYIDTPVKRYSSGMYVRLAFAVAAHLEPEILIVDEVLAVGDAEFQKKCLGKMQDVNSQDGRTVLFVSHNIASIRQLCQSGIYLKNGQIEYAGDIHETISNYREARAVLDSMDLLNTKRTNSNSGGEVKFAKVSLLNSQNQDVNTLYFGEPFSIHIDAISHIGKIGNLNIGLRFESENETYITSCLSGDSGQFYEMNTSSLSVGVKFDTLKLVPGKYFVTFSIRKGAQFMDQVECALAFSVDPIPFQNVLPHNNAWGLVQIYPTWLLN